MVIASTTAVTSAITAGGAVLAAVLIGLATLRARSFDDLVDELTQRLAEQIRKADRELLTAIQRELALQKRHHREDPE